MSAQKGMNGPQRNIQPRLPCLLVAKALVVASFALATLAGAEPGYPRKPVTIMMPYGAGGLGDVTLRMYAQKFAPRLGQQFIIDNRPGAGGAIAARAALAQPADGYTLFFCGSGMAISMSLFKTKPFELLRDFVQISTISKLDELLLATGANARFNSVKDVVEAARKDPGKITLGSINPGSTQNLTAHMFKQITGIEGTVVPYKSVPELITALNAAMSTSASIIMPDSSRSKATPGSRSLPLPGGNEARCCRMCQRSRERLSRLRGFELASPGGAARCSERRSAVSQSRDGRGDRRTRIRERLLKTGQSPGGSNIEAVNESMERESRSGPM